MTIQGPSSAIPRFCVQISNFHQISLFNFRGANSSVAVQPGTNVQSNQQISAEAVNLHAGKTKNIIH